MNVLTDKGFKRPTYDDLLENQIARAKNFFGDDIDTSELTALGKFMRINCHDVSKLYEELEHVYYARFPNTATGQSLDRLCVFAGITRNPPIRAIHTLKLIGEANTTVENGYLVGTNDNITFYLINDTEIDEHGEAVAEFECTEAGVIGNVKVGSIDKIINPDIYVNSIEHISVEVVGVEKETDVALRKRFSQSISGAGAGTIDSIYGEIMRVANVTGCMIVENDTDTTDNDGRPPNSFECFVLGGDDLEIAEAIFKKAPVGIAIVSTVPANTVIRSINDLGNYTHQICFTRTSEKEIYIKVKIKVDRNFEDDGVDQVINNLIYFLTTLTNGEDVILTTLYSYIHQVAGVRETSELLMSTDGTNYTAANIICAGHEVARTDTRKIVVEVSDYVDY